MSQSVENPPEVAHMGFPGGTKDQVVVNISYSTVLYTSQGLIHNPLKGGRIPIKAERHHSEVTEPGGGVAKAVFCLSVGVRGICK